MAILAPVPSYTMRILALLVACLSAVYANLAGIDLGHDSIKVSPASPPYTHFHATALSHPTILPLPTHLTPQLPLSLSHPHTQVALIKPGRIPAVVTNVESKRKTPNYIAFYGEERLFGGHAEAKRGSKPRHVIPEPFKLLGRGYTHPRCLAYSNNSASTTETAPNARGGVDLVLPKGSLPPSAGDGEPLSAEEASTQLLTHVREFTEAFAELKVPHAVFTVPMYATQAERAALLDVAALAGFKVLAIMDENTAAGVHYGIDRVTTNGTHYMMLYNMGAESTQVTLFAYDAYNRTEKGSSKNITVGQGRVVARAYDLELAGEAFDALLVDYVATAFNADPKVSKKLPKEAAGDIRSIPPAMVKISKAVVKAKEVLSANEAFPVSLEGVLPDVDFRLNLNRTLLETLAAPLWPRVTALVEAVLGQAGLSAGAVDAVELVGGAVRMPRIQALLKAHFAGTGAGVAAAAAAAAAVAGSEEATTAVGTHMNGDECFALGAVFVAANRSTSFKVRKVGMVEVQSFAVGVKLGHVAPEAPAAGVKPWSKRSPNLFGVYHAVDEKKRISFNSPKDLTATLYYENATAGAPELPPGTSKLLGTYTIAGVDELMANETFAARGVPKIHLTFHLDLFGIVSLAKAEATQEIEEVAPEPPATLKAAAGNKTLAAGNKTAAAGAAANATNSTATAANKTGEEGEGAAATTGNGTTPGAVNATPAAPKMVKTTLRFPLTFTLSVAGAFPVTPLTGADKEAILSRAGALKAEDEKKRSLETAKSDLEATIYKYRDSMEAQAEAVEGVTTEGQRTNMTASLAHYLEWHESEGGGASLEDYKKCIGDLKAVMEPAFTRAYEAEVRPKVVESALKEVNTWVELVGRWNITHPQVSCVCVCCVCAFLCVCLCVCGIWQRERERERQCPGETCPIIAQLSGVALSYITLGCSALG